MNILLFDVIRNIIVIPGLPNHLWCNSETKLPIYRIITQKNNGNDDNKTGWCKYLLNNYLYPFLLCDFCMNVLAGVMASQVFVYNNGLLTGRIEYCLIVVTILTFPSKLDALRLIKSRFMNFFNGPGPEPTVLAGIRRVEYF
ncbi:unnamed protein product [Rotaria socialis]|nr:unnamed protein product [Rotaria socialis]CAF3335326.1 unnamed protein product [Rotaria socialis]